MGKATVTGQITVTSNGTTLHTILQCTTGDVYQNYDGDPASPSNVVPNFEASGETKPKLVMQAYSAEQGAGNSFDLTRGTPTWIVAGVALTFNASHVSTNSFGGAAGHFTEGLMLAEIRPLRSIRTLSISMVAIHSLLSVRLIYPYQTQM